MPRVPFDEVGWPLYFDRTGTPISAKRCCELFEDPVYRFLREDTVGAVRIITVWLGIDADLRTPPHIFGTLVQSGSSSHETTHATEAEALSFHDSQLKKFA